jgi:hypothetical protein
MSFNVPWIFTPANVTGSNSVVPMAILALPAAPTVPSGSSSALVVSNNADQAINLKFFVNNPYPSSGTPFFPDLSRVSQTSGCFTARPGTNVLIVNPDPSWAYVAFAITPEGGAPLPATGGRAVVSTGADTDELEVNFISGTVAPDVIRFGYDANATSIIFQPGITQ